MRSASLHRSVGRLLFAALVAGCAPRVATAARDTFVTRFGCPPREVTVRELAGPLRPPDDLPSALLFEVQGCTFDVIYACEAGHASTDAIRSRSGWTPASCTPTGWCTEPGCDSVEEAARKSFAQDKGCPPGQVNATALWAALPVPPPDVAANPERFRIWEQFHQEQAAAHTVMTAAGCGAEATYDCKRPRGTRAIPICKATTSAEEPERPPPAGDAATPGATP